MPPESTPGSGSQSFVPPSAEKLHELLPKFDVLQFIGQGPMGIVYKARQPQLDRLVALKLYPVPPTAGDEFIERFEREAKTMARLAHPRIVTVHDFGRFTLPDSGAQVLYLVTEFVQGDTLERTADKRSFDQKEVLAIVTQVCDALKYAHEHGVIHRDIRPNNTMFDSEGMVKVSEFGHAKLMGADQFQSNLTMANQSLKTMDYIAPEQLEGGREVDGRADVYSVGVMLYKLLCGKLPRGTFVMPSEKNPELDTRLDDVIVKAMQSDPDDRYPDITSVWQAIDAVRTAPTLITGKVQEKAPVAKLVTGKVPEKAPPAHTHTAAVTTKAEDTAESPAEEPESKPFPLIPVLAITAVLAVVALGAYAIFKSPAEPEKPLAQTKIPTTSTPKPKPPPTQTSKIETQRSETKNPPSPPQTLDTPPATAQSPSPDPDLPPLDLLPPTLIGEVVAIPRADAPNDLDRLGPPPPEAKNAVAIVAPENLTVGVLILTADGKVVPWFDENGDGPIEVFTNIPEDLDDVVAIGAGAGHAVAHRKDGSLVSWGTDRHPQRRDIPDSIRQASKISVGYGHNLALQTDGSIKLWGGQDHRRLGMPENLPPAKAVAAGGAHSLVLHEDGSLSGWGRNDFNHSIINLPPDAGTPIAIGAVAENSLILTDDRTLYHFGQGAENMPPSVEDVLAYFPFRRGFATLTRDGVWQFHGEIVGKNRKAEFADGATQLAFDKKFVYALKPAAADYQSWLAEQGIDPSSSTPAVA
ncbi:MAG: protein kinase, partial [Verrucomicrobiota bacterium]